MPYYRSWDIVVVPFPFTDQQTTKVRPAVIVSTDILRQRNGKYLVAMITSAANAAQYGDVPISELSAAGLSKLPLERHVLRLGHRHRALGASRAHYACVAN